MRRQTVSLASLAVLLLATLVCSCAASQVAEDVTVECKFDLSYGYYLESIDDVIEDNIKQRSESIKNCTDVYFNLKHNYIGDGGLAKVGSKMLINLPSFKALKSLHVILSENKITGIENKGLQTFFKNVVEGLGTITNELNLYFDFSNNALMYNPVSDFFKGLSETSSNTLKIAALHMDAENASLTDDDVDQLIEAWKSFPQMLENTVFNFDFHDNQFSSNKTAEIMGLIIKRKKGEGFAAKADRLELQSSTTSVIMADLQKVIDNAKNAEGNCVTSYVTIQRQDNTSGLPDIKQLKATLFELKKLGKGDCFKFIIYY